MIQATLDTNGELTDTQIVSIINGFSQTRYTTNAAYYDGDNTAIFATNTKDTEEITPNNKIPVPFARKIALTTKNYLFARDPIYNAADTDYLEELNKVFRYNWNQSKISAIGENLIVHGVAYKLFYAQSVGATLVPRYTSVSPTQMIPVYSEDIEPVLIAGIRFYVRTDIVTNESKTHVEVYYVDKIVKFIKHPSALTEREEAMNLFFSVPLVVYGGEELQGVFEPVKEIIDAIDKVISSDVNEIERFEALYLILIGDKLPEDPKDVEKMVKRRIFELSESAQMSYLERHIDADFNMQLLDRLINLVHKMSGVPDFDSPEFAAESGVALQYKLMGFENVAAQYEAAFIRGEQESIALINALLYNQPDSYQFAEQNPDKAVDIELQRNMPEDVKARLEEAKVMKDLEVSTETVFGYLPMIKNPGEEAEKVAEEKEKNFERFQKTAFSQLTAEPEEEVMAQ